MNETGLECSPAADEMVITKTSAGVRVFVPLPPRTKYRVIGFMILVSAGMACTWLWGVPNFARFFGSIGVIFLSILCGLGLICGVVGAIVWLAMKRPIVIEVDANELRMWRAGASKPSRVWPRQKVRGIVIQAMPAGGSVLAVRVGFDSAVPLSIPYDSEKMQQAAESLHEALGLTQPPLKAGIVETMLGQG